MNIIIPFIAIVHIIKATTCSSQVLKYKNSKFSILIS